MMTGGSRFRVVVYREMDGDGCSADADAGADVVVVANSQIEAATMVLRSIGGGSADYVGVSAPDRVDAHMDAFGFVEDTCYMYCRYAAGVFAYDVKL